MIDVTDTPPPRSRSTCPHCDATPGGCRGLHFVGGRYCCPACTGDHDHHRESTTERNPA